MSGPRLRVRAPSRLHFGLLGWGPHARRQFGGLGLMIESPGITLSAEPAGSWGAAGPLATRVEQLLQELRLRLAEVGIPVQPVHITVHSAPAEHVGLGVGTQLSLAVACALLRLAGVDDGTVTDLGRLAGRGARSGIGIHGFRHGGLIVDGGRKGGTGIPPMVARLAFPVDWSILIVQPDGRRRGLHGADESRAFAQLPPIAGHVTERLCRLVLLELLPALAERDLPAFGAAVSELQAHVGALFAAAQGGPYTSPRATTILAELGRSGFTGIGQSSWGPTLYAFSDRPGDEVLAQAHRLCRRLGLEEAATRVTRADNQGASVVVER
jgi:beta-ribofuranosylaminobenzene 5'-phosphate synthase